MEPKTAVKVELARLGMTMTEFAEKIGIPQPSLSRTLNSSPVSQRSHWPAILAALDLEVTVQPKEKSQR